jgi:hypothetical protein
VSVVVLSVVMACFVMLSVDMQIIIISSVITVSVAILSTIMLSVVVPSDVCSYSDYSSRVLEEMLISLIFLREICLCIR